MRAIDIRRVDPAAAGLQHMHDAADNAPVIDPRLASRIARQKWGEPRKLILCQPETIAIHRGLLSETVNHIFAGKGIFMGPDPRPHYQVYDSKKKQISSAFLLVFMSGPSTARIAR